MDIRVPIGAELGPGGDGPGDGGVGLGDFGNGVARPLVLGLPVAVVRHHDPIIT